MADTFPPLVKIGYICEACGVDCRDVEMREKFPGENIIHYTHACLRTVSFDHGMRSPLCKAKTVTLALPISQKGIGVAGPAATKEDMDDLKRQIKEPLPPKEP